MTEGLFLINGDEPLTRLQPAEFEREDVFQALLARFPELLTDADFGEGEPRKWLLVTREAMVPAEADGSGRWSLDHLFLDQDGVPTLVEIKRASDTRLRREVVAQMLDYAANAVNYWKPEDIEKWLDKRCQQDGLESSNEALRTAFGIDQTGLETYWRSVRANLGSRRIRMIFVADRIERELEAIVAFLNEQMKDATVVALELAQFSNGTQRIVAPRIIGLTDQALASKRVTPAMASSVEDWLNNWIAGDEYRQSFKWFVGQMQPAGMKPRIAGQSLALDLPTAVGELTPVYLKSDGKISVPFYMLKKSPAFSDEQARRKLLETFEQAGFKFLRSNIDGEPSFPAPRLISDQSWQQLVGIVMNIIKELRGPDLPAANNEKEVSV
jgi:hypothetical protein